MGTAAEAVGLVALAELIGGATLRSAYVAVMLYGLTRTADGLAMSALRAAPLATLHMVRSHRHLLWHRARRAFNVSATGAWVLLVTLEFFSLRAPLLGWARGVLSTRYAIGLLTFSPGHVLALA